MPRKCAEFVTFRVPAGSRGENPAMSESELHVDPRIGGQRATDPSDEVIARFANRQGGVVSRTQLVARGITARSIERRLEAGRLRAIYRGVYAVGHDAIPIRGRLCAALLVAGPDSALSHRTAAYVLTLLPSMPPFVDVTTTNHRRRNRPGLAFHHAASLETRRKHGLSVTTPIRTLSATAPTARPAAPRTCIPQSGVEVRPARAAGRPPHWPLHRGFPLAHALAIPRDRTKDAALRLLGCTVPRVPEDELPDAPATVARFLN
jgi:hypothetical protein